MISKKIVDTDLFLDMPMSSRYLYYELNWRADDDGFVASPKKITKMVGCSDNDLGMLVMKHFIIPFDSGICVIKDWRIHNYIQKDRYHETQYIDEKSKLTVTDHNTYELTGNEPDTKCIHPVSNPSPEVRLGKDRLEIGKDREGNIGANSKDSPPPESPVFELILNDKSLFPILQSKIDEWKSLYPAVDVMQELRKMKGWLDANPTKRKTQRGVLRFVNGWLAKEQDRGDYNAGKNPSAGYGRNNVQNSAGGPGETPHYGKVY